MPFFIANYEHANYDNRKKLYALNKLYESGLLTELQSLEKAKVDLKAVLGPEPEEEESED